MGKIKIDTASILTLTTTLQRQHKSMENAAATVASIKANIDMNTASSEGVKSSLQSLQRRIQAQADLLEQYEAFLRRLVNDFSAADKKIAKNAKAVKYLMTQIKLDSVIPLANRPSLRMTEDIRRISELGKLFGAAGVATQVSLPWFNSGLHALALEELLNQRTDTSDMYKNYNPLEDAWDDMKNMRKGVGAVEDLADLYDVFGDSKFVDELGELAGDLKHTDLFKGIGYVSDAQKLYTALQENDMDHIEDLLEKYIKRGGKALGGLNGFEGAAYINLGWNLGENMVEGWDDFVGSDSLVVGAAEYAWKLTGWTLLETGSEMAYDIVDDVYKVFGGDLDQVYEKLTGTGGVEGFYKAVGMVGDAIGEGLQQEVAAVGDVVAFVGDAIGDAVAAVGDTVADWGDSISNVFKKLF